ncbi:MAG TPA: hypothetical protein VFY93_14900 [Planctomycetota bacterium]|nr:hypothetical protein [Planctomycetota bacterium]
MRTFLLVAAVAVVFAVGLLYVFRHAVRRSLRGGTPPVRAPETPPLPAPEEIPDVARRVRALQHAPEVQRLLAEFVQQCARRGAPAVAELLRRLADEPDVEIEPRWTFEEGRVRGFPSLRSAYIAALLEIPGPEARDALLAVLAATSSVDEAYQIAAGLARRGEGGFTPAALDRALRGGPGDLEVAREIVVLVSRADPDGTAAEVVSRSPRGEDGTDPSMLAQALELLPADRAIPTARGLLGDPAITRRGKERYLESLCNRGDPEIFASLREVAERGSLDRELRLSMAYAACRSRAFTLDEIAYAAAGNDEAARAAIRERYERRLAEVEQLVAAAVPTDAASGPVLESLRHKLAEKRNTVPGTR